MKIIDKNGKWFMNTGSFRLVDSTDPERLVYFEPGEPTRVNPNEWMVGKPNPNKDAPADSIIGGQPTLVEIADPTSDEVIEKSAKVKARAADAKNGIAE